ncbi:GDSL esterase/lipase At3g14820-like [Durio zibethinus]|uniref:GDSL esterase/lipase At3g14820-like n=1 Tax=Durio zibethinus TaxID=66656 RepID=A0A6P6AME4_DURZI|nr:GDSL esterase/lipase At3g14820-like [Durio zibethinus]
MLIFPLCVCVSGCVKMRSSSKILLALCVVLVFYSTEARIGDVGVTHRNQIFPARIAFGDSMLDTGNNNWQLTAIKCNFPPYERDLPGGIATGRFGNGKVLSDLIAEGLGIKSVVPPFLDPNLPTEELATAVCFASGGSGLYKLTAKIQNLISISDQFNIFKQYLVKLEGAVGMENAKATISNGVFLMSSGNNDIAITYFTILKNMEMAQPSCSEVQLEAELSNLNNNLSGAKIVFIDVFNFLLEVIQHYKKYGFDVASRSCCGTGWVEMIFLCNKYNPMTCPNPNTHVFCDVGHPSERAYRIIVPGVINQNLQQFSTEHGTCFPSLSSLDKSKINSHEQSMTKRGSTGDVGISMAASCPRNQTFSALLAFGDSILGTVNNNNLSTITKCNFPPYGKDFPGGKATGRFGNGKVSSYFMAESLGIKSKLPVFLEPNFQNEDFATVGVKKTKATRSNNLFLVSSGNNDIRITYFLILKNDINECTTQLVGWASTFLKDLHGIGAKKFAYLSTLPLECMPATRSTMRGNCVELANEAAVMFNWLNDSTHGWCGMGTVEAAYLCNQFNPLICSNTSNYVFWDAGHPSESAYKIIVSEVMDKILRQLLV